MNIVSLEIKKLYKQFSYKIDLSVENSLLHIFTGPNGYGKTTILQIIDFISKGELIYFFTFPFEKIEIEFTEDVFFRIISDNSQDNIESDDDNYIPRISFVYEDKRQNINNILDLCLEDFYKSIPAPYRRNIDIDFSSKQSVEFIVDFIKTHREFKIYEAIARQQRQEQLLFFMGNLKTVFIPAQRLYYLEQERDSGYYNRRRIEKKSSVDEVAKELKNLLQDYQLLYLQNAQKHDNQFLNKYLSFSGQEYSEEEFRNKSQELQLLINELFSYGLIERINLLSYNYEHRRILSVYLDDLTEKLDFYAKMLNKLRIFSSILDEKMFTNKRLELSPTDGLSIKLNDGTNININSLSSGEKNEIIMLYHLIFEVKENTILLIDEPEISLHVEWQLEFLDDIEKILEDKKIQVIIATHSPQIINEKWDLCFDFYANNRK